MWFRAMDLEVNPASRLLYSKLSPLALTEQFPFVCYFLVGVFGENDVAVLIVVVTVLVRVLDLGGVVRHKYYISSKEDIINNAKYWRTAFKINSQKNTMVEYIRSRMPFTVFVSSFGPQQALIVYNFSQKISNFITFNPKMRKLSKYSLSYCLPLKFILFLDSSMALNSPLVHQMKGTQFPFGVLNVPDSEIKKVLVKKKYMFKDEDEYHQLRVKIDKLKNITHKNTINLRSAEENSNSITLFYQYVPYSLEDSFQQNPSQTVKNLHRQFIELAIYLAKNCIVTSFNPQRCGVIINDVMSTIKYYLPLNDISITDNRSTLERSVQLFNVQSMSYLDNLMNQTLNTTMNENASQRTFKNRQKLFHDKQRKDSQPNGIFKSRDRKFSNNPNQQFQNRKLSSLSRQLTEISQIRKRNRASTRVSGGSFNTFQSIVSFQSQKDANIKQKNEECSIEKSNLLKRCTSLNGIETFKVQNVISRSKKALQSLKTIRKTMESFKQLYDTLKRIKYE